MAAVPTSALSAALVGFGSGDTNTVLKAGLMGGIIGALSGEEPSLSGLTSMVVGGACTGEATPWAIRGVAGLSTSNDLLKSVAVTACLESARRLLPKETLPAFIATMSKTEGVDKLCKAMQNSARALPYVMEVSSENIVGLEKVASGASTARGVLCLGQGIRTLPNVFDPTASRAARFKALSTVTFQTADNVAFAAKHSFLSPTVGDSAGLLARRACLAAYATDFYLAKTPSHAARALLDFVATLRAAKVSEATGSLPPWVDSAAALGAVGISVCCVH
eukprot:TRINITY_DN4791_c0_g2_i1.p1 TRINITY_DN4791_c0_g2~~TRINITY_DN4791_c0_g2_i1.p1  ORF type:complete len:278 (+),score=76.36 TRINITY_DN4791_c0_g2_i1:331-1164(+)